MNPREELAVLQRARDRRHEQDEASADTFINWLKGHPNAKKEEIAGALAEAVPKGSKPEALSRLRLLRDEVKALVETEKTKAPTAALGLISDLIRMLEAARDERPLICPPGDLLEVTVETWERIREWCKPNMSERFLARFGESICRLQRADNGALGTCPLDQAKMVHLLTLVARWGHANPLLAMMVELLFGTMDQAAKDAMIAEMAAKQPPPGNVATNILADPNRQLPVLDRVVEVPVVAPDGSIHERRGYDPRSRCFHEPAAGLKVPKVASRPGLNDVMAAKDLLLGNLLVDFPFADDASKAHAIAFGLEPFVRGLIKGCTPLYLFDAPTPGTGKGLLVDVLAVPTMGDRVLAKTAGPKDPDEWRKKITAKLRTSPAFLIIDNVSRKLDSDALALTLTTGMVEDRLLGVSEMVNLPVRCTFAATGNNVQLSDEMVRRTVRVRIDSELEDPENRENFKHKDLKLWALENRGDLVWALLTLARAWVVEGCQPGPEKPLGSFEPWTRVMGGILASAGIEGLLTDREELRSESSDTETAELLHAIYTVLGKCVLNDVFGTQEFKASAPEVLTAARSVLALGDSKDDAASRKLGYRFRSVKDRPRGGLVLRAVEGKSTAGGRTWRIEKTRAASGDSDLSGSSGSSGFEPPICRDFAEPDDDPDANFIDPSDSYRVPSGSWKTLRFAGDKPDEPDEPHDSGVNQDGAEMPF